MVNTVVGQETDILKELRAMEEVEEAHLKDLINFKIRHLKGVNSTLTMIVVSKQSNSHFHT
jgi:hypothetical protein